MVSNSCKNLFAFLLVQESFGTKVIPKQKQFKQPERKMREEGGRFISSSALQIIFRSFQITQYTIAGTVKREYIRKGQSSSALSAAQCVHSDVWGGKVTTTDFTASLTSFCLHPPLIIQGYEEKRLNAFLWSLCLSWWHIKKNPAEIKRSSPLLKNDIVTVQYRLK